MSQLNMQEHCLVEWWGRDMSLHSSGRAMEFLRRKFPNHADVVVEVGWRQTARHAEQLRSLSQILAASIDARWEARMLEQG